MTRTEQCRDCDADLDEKISARETQAGTVGAAGGEIPRRIASAIYECSSCGAHWTKHGIRLVRLGG